jgi:putative endonuclease
MADHNELGKKGEALAAEYLEKKGYQILHTNWRNRFEEIDIVAQDKQMIVFVEVKTRSNTLFGQPEEQVGFKKQRLLVNAAEAYINQYNIDLEARFDIVSVILNDKLQQIKHFEHAFSPFD